jgi:hypothetical protein
MSNPWQAESEPFTADQCRGIARSMRELADLYDKSQHPERHNRAADLRKDAIWFYSRAAELAK